MAKPLTPPMNTGLVARWILSAVQASGQMSRRELVDGIRARFGDEYVQVSKIGRVNFLGSITDHMRRLNRGAIVYDRLTDTWRVRS